MNRVSSLRKRLFFLIVSPLLLMALLLGFWRLTAAQRTAEDLFDRSLLSAALAISRDVVISDGDVLSPSTNKLIGDAAGGQVFYHSTGPGGIYVTGYAYPPNGGAVLQSDPLVPVYFEAMYRGEPVRVLQINEEVTIDGITGNATITVWQRMAERNRFVTQLAMRAVGLILGLLSTLVLVVWFGVERGLRPLLDLKDAIELRSPDDLSQIRRPVPSEAQGIVETLNRLFDKVEDSISAHQVFISNAAHQLRNPAAAVQSMAEALRDAPSEEDRKQRLEALVTAARNTARVTDQLLSMDRLRQPMPDSHMKRFDLSARVEAVCAEIAPSILSSGIEFSVELPEGQVEVTGDQVFIGETVKNLIDNAMTHGGDVLSAIDVSLRADDRVAWITVQDDGIGLSVADQEAAFGRFSQLEPSAGSGLGLAIASSVAERHGGRLRIDPTETGASLTLFLRRSPEDQTPD